MAKSTKTKHNFKKGDLITHDTLGDAIVTHTDRDRIYFESEKFTASSWSEFIKKR